MQSTAHGSMHNRPRTNILFMAFYNDLPRRGQRPRAGVPTSKVLRNSPHPHSADVEQDAIRPHMSWQWLNAWLPEMCECLIVASVPLRKSVVESTAYGVSSRRLPGSVSDCELGSANSWNKARRRLHWMQWSAANNKHTALQPQCNESD